MNIVVFYSRINYVGVWRNGRSGAKHCYKLNLKEILVGLVTLILFVSVIIYFISQCADNSELVNALPLQIK